MAPSIAALVFLAAAVLPASTSAAPEITSLAGHWHLVNGNGSVSIAAATVPGYVTEALLEHKLIGDPLFRMNEDLQRWISHDVWTFERSISLPEACAQGEACDLVLDGLDTLADVFWNGQHILAARSFHRQHRVSLARHLLAGVNTIRITFNSSVQQADAAASAYPYPVPSNPTPRAYLNYNFIRKPASDFGWDWGPAIAPVGIHGNITLVRYREPYITGVHVQQSHQVADHILLTVEAEVWSPTAINSSSQPLTLSATLPDLGLEAQIQVAALAMGVNNIPVKLAVPKAQVKLWWPRGLGAQKLYDLNTHLSSRTSRSEHRRSLHKSLSGKLPGGLPEAQAPASISKHWVRVGFRHVELVRQPLDAAWQDIHGTASGGARDNRNGSASGTTAQGESFYFRLNGVPVYVQGANLIPLDVLHTRAGPGAVEALLRQAAHANMNMIRVWGGGRYQISELYDWCDQHGIMVWQELMYACGPYPQLPELIAQGVLEAQAAVRRLAWHPSVVIWGGNNEVESSFLECPDVQANLGLYVSDFNVWFTDALRHVLLQLDPDRPYVDTSPSNGLFSSEPYIKRWGNPQDPRHGDVHFYNYEADCQDPYHYPPAKFVSEAGWQSAASWQAISRVTEKQDWDPWSPGAQYRQRHPDGDAQLLAQLARHFKLPPDWMRHCAASATCRAGANLKADVDQQQQGQPEGVDGSQLEYIKWIYYTQVQQALCQATAIQRWKLLSADPQALNMGVLYWQLNDIWPGYSWSSLDHPSWPGAAPHWKPLHYQVAKLFAPLAVLTHVTQDGDVQVHLSSSVRAHLQADLSVRLVRLNTTQPTDCAAEVHRAQVTLPPLALQLVWSVRVEELLSMGRDCTVQTCYASVEVSYQLVQKGDDGSSSRQSNLADNQWQAGFLSAAHLGQSKAAGGTRAKPGLPDVVLVPRTDAAARVGGKQQQEQRRAALEMGSSRHSRLWANVWSSRGSAGSGGAFISTQIWFAYFKDMDVILESSLGDPDVGSGVLYASDWRLQAPSQVCFTAAVDRVMPLVVLEAQMDGHFTDNMLNLDPCLTRRLCFVYEGEPKALEEVADTLIDTLTFMSLVADV